MVKRVVFLVAILLLLVVLFGFSRRIAEYSRLNAQLERESARITELAATQDYLQDRIAYATSEAAVEEWAREDARWARPGDFPIIPLVPPGFTPEAPSEEEGSLAAASNWETWWNWFFYTGP
jgi:cell division protein FtsB